VDFTQCDFKLSQNGTSMHSFSPFGPLNIVSYQLLLGRFCPRSLSHFKSDKLLGFSIEAPAPMLTPTPDLATAMKGTAISVFSSSVPNQSLHTI